jgi:hypothetical protein
MNLMVNIVVGTLVLVAICGAVRTGLVLPFRSTAILSNGWKLKLEMLNDNSGTAKLVQTVRKFILCCIARMRPAYPCMWSLPTDWTAVAQNFTTSSRWLVTTHPEPLA